MEPAILGIVLDSSIIIEAERKHQTVEELLQSVQQRFGEVEITMSAVTLAELVHGIARADTEERRDRRRAFIDSNRASYDAAQPRRSHSIAGLAVALAANSSSEQIYLNSSSQTVTVAPATPPPLIAMTVRPSERVTT
jgi:predicted nucleic acid-binding protein